MDIKRTRSCPGRSDKKSDFETQLYRIGLAAILFGGIAGWIYLRVIVPRFSPPCALYRITGIYCPGCGGTRAVEALLHGHPLLSLWLHPLVLYTLVIFGGFMLTQTLARLRLGHIRGWKFHNWYLWGALGILTVNWLLKNILLVRFGIALPLS